MTKKKSNSISGSLANSNVLLEIKSNLESNDSISENAKRLNLPRKTYINRRTGQLMDNLKEVIKRNGLPHRLNSRNRIVRVMVKIPNVGLKLVKPLVIDDQLIFLTKFKTKDKNFISEDEYVSASEIFGESIQITRYSIKPKSK